MRISLLKWIPTSNPCWWRAAAPAVGRAGTLGELQDIERSIDEKEQAMVEVRKNDQGESPHADDSA